MQIIKVGGIIVSNKYDLDKIIKNIDTEQKTVLIFSAFGKTTQIIKDLINLAISEDSDYTHIFFDLKQFFQEFSKSQSFREQLSDIFLRFQKMLNSIQILGECPAKTMDYLLSYGEILSGLAFKYYLIDNKVEVKLYDFKELIITDSNYNQANVLLEESTKNIQKKVDDLIFGINLFAGFVSTDSSGNVTTMGFESSNLSAVVFAIGFGKTRVKFITDVDGIYSFDPKKYSKAIPLKRISYSTANIAARIGIKILTHNMMDLAIKNLIEIEFEGIESQFSSLISSDDSNSFIIIKDDINYIICGKSLRHIQELIAIKSVTELRFIKDHKLELVSGKDILDDLHDILFSK